MVEEKPSKEDIEFNKLQWKQLLRTLNYKEQLIASGKQLTEYKDDGKNLKQMYEILNECEEIQFKLKIIKEFLLANGLLEKDTTELGKKALTLRDGYEYATLTAQQIKK